MPSGEPLAINPSHICAFCTDTFGCDNEREIIVVESGEIKPMRKDPSFLRFYPDHEHTKIIEKFVLDYYHADCFIERMRGMGWGKNSPHECDSCGRTFHRWAFRAILGHQDFETGMFVPLRHPENQAVLCPDCICEGFGEGDMDRGAEILRL